MVNPTLAYLLHRKRKIRTMIRYNFNITNAKCSHNNAVIIVMKNYVFYANKNFVQKLAVLVARWSRTQQLEQDRKLKGQHASETGISKTWDTSIINTTKLRKNRQNVSRNVIGTKKQKLETYKTYCRFFSRLSRTSFNFSSNQTNFFFNILFCISAAPISLAQYLFC